MLLSTEPSATRTKLRGRIQYDRIPFFDVSTCDHTIGVRGSPESNFLLDGQTILQNVDDPLAVLQPHRTIRYKKYILYLLHDDIDRGSHSRLDRCICIGQFYS